MELTFFIVAGMVLCFGFITKTVLTHPCFIYCCAVLTQCQGLFCFSHHLPTSRLGQDKKLGGDS